MNNGRFQSTISLGIVSSRWHIAGAADFNSDGHADLIWENTASGARAIWLLNNGMFSSVINLQTVDRAWHIVNH